MIDWASMVLITLGLFFYLSGTLGLLRFPDTYTRLHALTKADNLGLGLLMTGLLLQVNDVFWGIKLVLVWLLMLAASAVNAYLIARFLYRREADADGC
ncbi:MAG: monovalent cation/H(+) antiporter subunit G [Thiolinea sp.]